MEAKLETNIIEPKQVDRPCNKNKRLHGDGSEPDGRMHEFTIFVIEKK
jgi:hypothetical protein